MCVSLVQGMYRSIITPNIVELAQGICSLFYTGVLKTNGNIACELIGVATKQAMGVDFMERFIPLMTCKKSGMCTHMEMAQVANDPMPTPREFNCTLCSRVLEIVTPKLEALLVEQRPLICTLLDTIYQHDAPCNMIYMENGFKVIKDAIESILKATFPIICPPCYSNQNQSDINETNAGMISQTFSKIKDTVKEDVKQQLENGP